ncbi:MAG: chloride channel protein [Phycisphaerae bacterium]|nr:chloride channel protein [Phycisphaerae bacterium]
MHARDILDRLPRPAARWSRLFALGTLVGALGGLAAAGMEWGLHHGAELLVGRFTHLGSEHVFAYRWEVLLLPALGGLASGVAVRLLCPTSIGQGTDVLTRAFHQNMGNLPLKGPLIRNAAAVGVISCGGSAGPEGPIAALGAALGSSVGNMFRLTPRERRVLLVAGCAAGVGAIFRCPLGGALFAASVLYREEEFEAEAVVPAFVSSVIGYSTFMTLWGGLGHFQYLLQSDNFDPTLLGFVSPIELLPYAVLGPLCGLVAIFFGWCFRLVERRIVPWSRLPRWLTPAVGGLATGALACMIPQVMDGRYRFILNTLVGFQDMTVWALVALFAAVVLAKCMATALTVGSGASGGVLGPGVFMGGAVGAFLGALLQAVFPGLLDINPHLGQALIAVGMGGVLAATMRTPLACIVMVCEMTGSYGLIVPLMVVCISSYVVGRRWGLNDEQVRGLAQSPAHAGDAIVHMLESWKVGQLMEPHWEETVTPDTPLRGLVERIKPGTRPTFAVAKQGRLLGLISVPDIRRITEELGQRTGLPVTDSALHDDPASEAVIAMDIMTERMVTVCPHDDVYRALEELRRSNHDVLPVVSRQDGPRTGSSSRWVGMLTRERVFETVRRNIAETQKLMFHEHKGLTTIEHEGQLQQLVMGVSPMQKDMIQRHLVPMDAVGKSLRQADFRRVYGAQVIAIEQPDGSLQCPPDLDAPLSTGQRLLAIVWQ